KSSTELPLQIKRCGRDFIGRILDRAENLRAGRLLRSLAPNTERAGHWRDLPTNSYPMMIKIRCNRALSTLSCVRASKTSIFTFLISLVAVSIVSGQTAQRKPLATEPLERYDNLPAYIFRLETSPRMISQFGPFTSFQVNVDANGNNIAGAAANEPSIAVDPTNLSKRVVGWRQFNSLQSNFRQGGWGYTIDGDTT